MCGVMNGGSDSRSANTLRHRADPVWYTASHECGENGVPSSDSHSHNGSSPVRAFHVQQRPFPRGSTLPSARCTLRPRWSVQCSTDCRNPVRPVTTHSPSTFS